MKGVIYARYSSDNQREESIEGQLRECKEFAEKKGITILTTYIDRALSGKTDSRPDFQRMIKDSSKHLFDVVIVWKMDRFARNRYDSIHNKMILRRNNVKVISATEPISDDPSGILLESMLEGYAEYFSAELAVKVSRGQTENALKCKYNGIGIPLGFYIDNEQHYQIDEQNALVAREVFKRYDEGATIIQLVRWLKEKGIKTYRGTDMSIDSVKRMLRNRRYIGEYAYGKIIIPEGIPAIIPADLFDRVQERLIKNKKAPARYKAKEELYLLSSKLHCGLCGAFMLGECGTSMTGRTYQYYKVPMRRNIRVVKRKPSRKFGLKILLLMPLLKSLWMMTP